VFDIHLKAVKCGLIYDETFTLLHEHWKSWAAMFTFASI